MVNSIEAEANEIPSQGAYTSAVGTLLDILKATGGIDSHALTLQEWNRN